jgi:hypothetical protein
VWYVNSHKSIKRGGQVANKLLTTKMKEYVNEKYLVDLRESIEKMNTSMDNMKNDMLVLKKSTAVANNPDHSSRTMNEGREESV